MNELKPCPFCGGAVKLSEQKETMSFITTVVECCGCNMEFSYTQDFCFSTKARVAINESFENLWNRRVDNE